MSNGTSNPAPVAYDARGFIVCGRREFLIGGEFHYFRTPSELWEDRLVKMKRTGANLVTTYIPWNWHEPTEGSQIWTGDRDLAHFLDLCTKHGLFIVVKPGPYCCAEWDFGGHPDWLLSKNIPLRVLNDRYLEYVRQWYGRVAEIIAPYLVTSGGNIICIQVENEYDHLMEFGDEKISKEDAIAYFTRLAHMMTEFGIDIPKFANEAAFLRGRNHIIDTRTYYPNIPLFQYWMFQHNYFDGKIQDAKKGQPDCPTMILELQIGWFAQFGRPLYIAPLHLTESVSKSVVSLGATLLNYYMYVGGTTFPFWGCRGNIWDILPRGTGTATTFDFGGSPIREWGELMPGRIDYIEALSQFTRDYGPLIQESDNVEDLKVLGGGEGVVLVGPGSARPDTAIGSQTENFKVIARRLGDQYLVCARNLGAEPKTVDIGFAATGEKVIEKLEVHARETHLLPVNVRVPGSAVTIRRSSSELLFAHAVEGRVYYGLFGKPGRAGETVLSVPASQVRVLSGQVRVSGDAEARLEYVHDGMLLVETGRDRLVILEQDLAGKVEEVEEGILLADTYFVRDLRRDGATMQLRTEMRNGSKNTFTLVADKTVASAKIAGRPAEVSRDAQAGVSSFAFSNRTQRPVKVEWLGGWRIRPDTAEAAPDYDDGSWTRLSAPVSLEEAGLLQHGYIWYRGEFELPDNAGDATLTYPGNDCDRQHVFVNGRHVWEGITDGEDIGIGHAVRPGRNIVAVLYENFFHSKSHPHEGAIRKYSGIMKPVVVTARTAGGESVVREIASFRVREQLDGVLQGFAEPRFDDSAWQEVPAAHKYVMDEALGTIVWMRRRFRYACKKNWSVAVRLAVPDAHARCLLYVNGKAVGQFENVGPQHEFYVPEPFLQKENVLAVVLEGPRAFITEPAIDTFYEAKQIDVEITLAT